MILLWTVSSGSLSDPTIANPVFSAVGATSPVIATFTVTTGFGSATSSTAITVASVPPPVISHIPPITIFVTSAQYRTNKNKLRLDVIATSSVISPNVVLVLQPYLTVTGATYDPSWVSFANTGGGQYTLTLVGVPEPAVPPATPIQVRSNLGGVSPPFPVSIRQYVAPSARTWRCVERQRTPCRS